MFRIVVITVSALLLFVPYASAGQSGNYAGIASGISITESSTLTDRNGSDADLNFDLGVPVSLYVGRQLESGLRIDAELFYRYVAIKDMKYAKQSVKLDSDIQSFGALGNLYYNFFHGFADAPWSPYLGLGAGVATIQMSAGSDDRFTYWQDDNDTVFAYQGIIGFNVPLRKDLLLDVSYRYLGTTDFKIDQVETDMKSHNVLLGIRYFW